MSVQGDLTTFDVADLLGWIVRRTRTGVLRLRRGATEKRLDFERGRLCASASNDPRESLAQALLREGSLDEERLVQGLARQEQEARPLAELLIEDGALSSDQLRYTLARNTEEIVCDVFLWNDGTFHYEDQPAVAVPLSLSDGLDVGLVIEEGQYRREQWRELRRRFPSSEVCFRVGTPTEPATDPVERTLVALAAAGRTLAGISLEAHRSLYETSLRLNALVERGVLAPDVPANARPELDPVGTIQALLASALELRRERRYEAALGLYDEVLALDALNQDAKRGRLAAREEQRLVKLAERLPREQVPALRLGAVALTREHFDPQEGFVLSRVNGQWNVGAIVKLCPLPEAETLAILLRLLERSVITLHDAGPSR